MQIINIDVLRRLGLAVDHLTALATLADGGTVTTDLHEISEALGAAAGEIEAAATNGHTRETVGDLMDLANAATVVTAAISAAEDDTSPTPRPPGQRAPIGQLRNHRAAAHVPRLPVEQRRTAPATIVASSGRPVEGASDVAREFLARLASFPHTGRQREPPRRRPGHGRVPRSPPPR